MGISIVDAFVQDAKYFGFKIELRSAEYIIGRNREDVKFSLMRESDNVDTWRLGIVQGDVVLLDESDLTYIEALDILETYGD